MSGITGVKMGVIVRESYPYVALQFFVLALCIFFPSLVTALPRALGF
jgi:TRAP-type C4-dicarboxylate transport system permease large subunit